MLRQDSWLRPSSPRLNRGRKQQRPRQTETLANTSIWTTGIDNFITSLPCIICQSLALYIRHTSRTRSDEDNELVTFCHTSRRTVYSTVCDKNALVAHRFSCIRCQNTARTRHCILMELDVYTCRNYSPLRNCALLPPGYTLLYCTTVLKNVPEILVRWRKKRCSLPMVYSVCIQLYSVLCEIQYSTRAPQESPLRYNPSYRKGTVESTLRACIVLYHTLKDVLQALR